MLSESVSRIYKSLTEGPLTFRVLGFLGGLAMIVSNGLAILERIFSFQLPGAIM